MFTCHLIHHGDIDNDIDNDIDVNSIVIMIASQSKSPQ